MKSLKLDECEIIFPDKKILKLEERERIIGSLKEKLHNRANQAYIFGSFARGDVNPHSDIDLVIIKDTKTNFINRAEEFFDLMNVFPSIDILVYTPKEFNKLINETSPGFWRAFLKENIRII